MKNSLDYEFADARLLELALTHRSAAGNNNERLEFLGDAVLDLVISEVVFRSHPLATEGDLSRLRASLVNDQSLAEIAGELGIGKHLYLGSGERKSGGHRRRSILADALEAVFGAIYLDSGFEATRVAIEKAFGHRLHEFPDVESLRDAKSRLQEWMQARQMGLPEYELHEVSGEAHQQTFEVSCRAADNVTKGSGTTRRTAEQQAAEAMLSRLHAADEA
ncbi:MAG: ribonuclease III [Woeseiaceae bacterium]|nr:ribonuclease III [Woeseiaceae bacterium]NIP19671.1 ribonuclease III [Woeseiaceae bacterium]NIS89788.1 ribonuclease III [Woeseiaceae bacterium]